MFNNHIIKKEKKMEDKNKQCCICKYFRWYYIRGEKKFSKIKFGRCYKKCETVNIHDSCNGFVLRTKKQTNEIFLNIYLEHLLTEINELRLLMEAEINENNEL